MANQKVPSDNSDKSVRMGRIRVMELMEISNLITCPRYIKK